MLAGSVRPARPARWLMIQRTGMSALPLAANSGQYLATGASGSSSPRSIRTCAHSEVIAFVVDQTLVRVSSSHGRVRAGSAQPPHRFTTGSPFATTATLAPISPRSAKFCANASRTGSKAGAQVPWISVSASVMRATSPGSARPGAAPSSPECYAVAARFVNGPLSAGVALGRALHPALGADQVAISQPPVQAPLRCRRQDLTEIAHCRMADRRPDQERAETMATVRGVDEHVA